MTYIPGGGGSGTVTSVAANGGTTGFGFTGSPITASGTLALTISNAATARTALGLATVAASGAYGDLTGRPTAVSAFTNDAGYITASTITLNQIEVSLGTNAKHGGKFTIPGSGLTVGKPVLIAQAVGPYTGKGTRADEAEMDQVSVSASVTDAATITAYWASPRRVKGNFKFNYQVSA